MPKRFEISELKIGQKLSGNFREFDFVTSLRVEAIGIDWAVVRDNKGHPMILTEHSNIEALIPNPEKEFEDAEKLFYLKR